MRGQVLSSRKQRRERKTFWTCFAVPQWSRTGTWHAWRGTEFSRGRPPPTRAAACSRTLPLAINTVVFLLPVVTEHRQFCVAGIGICPSSARHENGQERAFSTIRNARNSGLVVLAQISTRTQNNLRVFGPNVSTAVCIFGRVRTSCVYCKCVFVCFVYFCFSFCF